MGRAPKTWRWLWNGALIIGPLLAGIPTLFMLAALSFHQTSQRAYRAPERRALCRAISVLLAGVLLGFAASVFSPALGGCLLIAGAFGYYHIILRVALGPRRARRLMESSRPRFGTNNDGRQQT